MSKLANIILLLALIAAAWILIGYVRRSFESISVKRPRTRFPFRVSKAVLEILLWSAILGSAARLLLPGENTAVVVLGSAILAAGLSARELAASLFGGLFMIVDRPYEVGDRVKVDGINGEIRRIGLGTTKVVTEMGAVATVPHARLLSGIAQNDTAGSSETQVVTEMFLPANADPDVLLSIGREALITSPYLCLRRPIATTLVEGIAQAPYLRLKLEGYVYDYHSESKFQTELLRRCRAEFGRRGLAAAGPPAFDTGAVDSRLEAKAGERREATQKGMEA